MLISIDQHKTPSDIKLGVLRQLMLWKGPWLPESETHVRRLPQDSTWEEALRSLRDRLLNLRTMRPDIERLSRLWVKQNENFYCYMERWFDLLDCLPANLRDAGFLFPLVHANKNLHPNAAEMILDRATEFCEKKLIGDDWKTNPTEFHRFVVDEVVDDEGQHSHS